jgi:hypothetical protein
MRIFRHVESPGYLDKLDETDIDDSNRRQGNISAQNS